MPSLKDYLFSDKEKRDIIEWYKQFNEMCNKEGIALDQGIGFDRIQELAYDKSGKAGLHEAFGKKGLHPEIKFPSVEDLDKMDPEQVKLLLELKEIMGQGNLYLTPKVLKSVSELRKMYLDGEGNPVVTPPGVKPQFDPRVQADLEIQIEGRLSESSINAGFGSGADITDGRRHYSDGKQQAVKDFLNNRKKQEQAKAEESMTDEDRMRLGLKRKKPFETLGEVETFTKVSKNPNAQDACEAFSFVAKYSNDHPNDKSVTIASAKILNDLGGMLNTRKKEDPQLKIDLSKEDVAMAQKTMVRCKAIVAENNEKSEAAKAVPKKEAAPVISRPDPVFGGPVLTLKKETEDNQQ